MRNEQVNKHNAQDTPPVSLQGLSKLMVTKIYHRNLCPGSATSQLWGQSHNLSEPQFSDL